MIKGLFETHINVSNYETSARFYEKLLNIIPLQEDHIRKSKFYWIGKAGESMLGIRENYPSRDVQRQHFAFRVELEDIVKARNYLNELGIESTNFFGDSSEELTVFPFMPAVSIYFDDPDGHSVEFIAMLDEKPRPELNIMSWKDWSQLHGK
ncbi:MULTISPECIES: VOC family protein [Paenibacillus]|uniref:VOC family protein n=1 Tax=Paenibacillus TaxID=44249 RepID=UPI000E3D6ACF|nr:MULTISPECIES: VOC family protein [Paenibacillus]MEE4580868.1 VOC family protein [Paenibacillus polymyxa]RFT94081.1 VOC family protein [Paenibacillus jamilae]URJ37219.1 VOC family protein [Paenibacillus polymyxa]